MIKTTTGVQVNPADHGPFVRGIGWKKFQSSFDSWDTMFGEAAKFAATLSPGRLINISHSEDHSEGVVVVWYYVPVERG